MYILYYIYYYVHIILYILYIHYIYLLYILLYLFVYIFLGCRNSCNDVHESGELKANLDEKSIHRVSFS